MWRAIYIVKYCNTNEELLRCKIDRRTDLSWLRYDNDIIGHDMNPYEWTNCKINIYHMFATDNKIDETVNN